MNPANLFRTITSVFGWLLYCFGWFYIVHFTPRREPLLFVAFLCFAALILYVGVQTWVAHNRRLARVGKRGNMTRYTSPSYSRDHLGRELVFDPQLALAREVTVSATENRKVYIIAPGMRAKP